MVLWCPVHPPLRLPAVACVACAVAAVWHSQAGAAGIGIITLLRVVSGAAVGNTAPAALVYLTEHAPQCPSLHASLVPASMAAGACAASSLALLLSWVMGPAVLAASGWRVVLVMSLLGNAITGWLRGYVLQEPEGKMQAAELLDRSNAHVGTILWWVVMLEDPPVVGTEGLGACLCITRPAQHP